MNTDDDRADRMAANDLRRHNEDTRREAIDDAARAMLAALERSLHLIEKADADSGCLAYTEIATQHRAAIAAAKAAGIKVQS